MVDFPRGKSDIENVEGNKPGDESKRKNTMNLARVEYRATSNGMELPVPYKASRAEAAKLGAAMLGIPSRAVTVIASWIQKEGDKYLLCGTDRNGKRFRMESGNFHYLNGINAWRGNLYLVADEKRYLLKEIIN